MAQKNLFDSYRIKNPRNNLQVRISIGYRQNSMSWVWLDGRIIPKSENKTGYNRKFKVNLGKSEDLKGKLLTVSTFVQDVSKDTDKTSVKIELSDGVNHYEGVLRSSVTDNMKVIGYTFEILFR